MVQGRITGDYGESKGILFPRIRKEATTERKGHASDQFTPPKIEGDCLCCEKTSKRNRQADA